MTALISKNELRFSGFEAIEYWLRNADIKSETLRKYRKGLELYRGYLLSIGIDDLGDVSVENLIGFKQMLIDNVNFKPNTKNTYMEGVKSFYAYVSLFGYPNIGKSIKNIYKVEKFKSGEVGIDDFRKILSGIDRSTYWGKRDYFIMCMAFTTGIRQVSMRNLRWCDFRYEKVGDNIMVIADIILKGSGVRTQEVVLNNITYEALVDYREAMNSRFNEFKDEWYMFTNDGRKMCDSGMRTIIRELLKKSGVWKNGSISGHSIRHGSARYILEKTGDVQLTSEHLGHKNVATTMFYVKKDRDIQRMKTTAGVMDLI